MSRRTRVWVVRGGAVLLAALGALGLAQRTEIRRARASRLARIPLSGPLPSNTIVVRGSRAFRESVIEALLVICPCYNPGIGEDNQIGLTPLTGVDESGDELFCPCYCDHRAGCNLLLDLVSADQETTIRGRNTNQYNPRNKDVYWDSDATPDVPVEDGAGGERDAETPPAITLAHELIHALHDAQGTRSEDELTEESNTVRGENQIRDETGAPAGRTSHRGRRIPNHRNEDLDRTVRAACECPE